MTRTDPSHREFAKKKREGNRENLLFEVGREKNATQEYLSYNDPTRRRSYTRSYSDAWAKIVETTQTISTYPTRMIETGTAMPQNEL